MSGLYKYYDIPSGTIEMIENEKKDSEAFNEKTRFQVLKITSSNNIDWCKSYSNLKEATKEFEYNRYSQIDKEV